MTNRREFSCPRRCRGGRYVSRISAVPKARANWRLPGAQQRIACEPLLLDVQVSEGYPLWAALPPGRQRSPKVLEFLTERLGLAPQTTGKD